MKPHYTWSPPKAVEGEHWGFYDHPRNGREGSFYVGRVAYVDTHYDQHGQAYHGYHMQVEGWKRRRIVGEESLVSKVEGGT